jgi:hypothetical protein
MKEWIDHADIDTTTKYLHYAPRPGEADLIATAFAPPSITSPGERSRI